MTFVYKEERKFGPTRLSTKPAVGPGTYISSDSCMGTKKRISVKEPFAAQVDRDGKNS